MAAENGLLLEIENLSAWYGKAQALFKINLTVRRGEVVALIGRNGAGKSTLLKAVVGLQVRRSGRIEFLQRDILRNEPYRTVRMGLAYVPEDRRIFSNLSVTENLEVGRQAPRRWPNGSELVSWTTDRIFQLFPNLSQMKERAGANMSGGEQQMLTIARSLMGNPYLVLLDEPFEGLAPVVVAHMAKIILQLKAQGMGVLISEQNNRFSELVADRTYVLEKGEIYSGRSI